ncbi:Uncharacterised protein [Mycobacteroides abscessus subsp. abscessus]|nr:Uncharacterised protein [Mycobacteroides abscessus subsp. abscessus]
MRASAPKKSTGTPLRLRSRSAMRQTTRFSRNRWASSSYGPDASPVSASTSNPRVSR